MVKRKSPARWCKLTSTVLLVVMACIMILFTLLWRNVLSQNVHVAPNTAGSNPVVIEQPKSVISAPSPVIPLSQSPKTELSPYAPAQLPKNFKEEIHFIHVPKCGGTSMTAVLRQVMCDVDPINHRDCCTNPGFCDFHANRKCSVIKGCINHFPNRPFIYTSIPSITMLREPLSRYQAIITHSYFSRNRLLSAWFYRGHNPNLDFFQVRPEFKDIKEGRAPKATFDQYIDMPEYNNIMTRMLGKNSFPYRNITITEEIYRAAEDAMNHLFFVGIQEAYDLSIELLLRELNTTLSQPIQREREQKSGKINAAKEAIVSNRDLMQRAQEANQYDIRLYKAVTMRWCNTLKKYPDLLEKLDTTKVTC